jgi:hypothetical protein
LRRRKRRSQVECGKTVVGFQPATQGLARL